MITVNNSAALNFEVTPTFNLTVQADDGNGGTDTRSVTINLNDVNDPVTGTVSIAGDTREGQTLTASNTLSDEDGLGAIGYQWQRDTGGGFVDITGETGGTYLLAPADLGADIRVIASFTDGGGTNESVTSSSVGPVVEGTPPEFSSIETADTNGDGFIDVINITFSEGIEDDSVVADDFSIGGSAGTSFSTGSTVDDNQITITFADGLFDTGATPTVSYTQDNPTDADLTDLNGNPLANRNISPAWWDSGWQHRTKITFDNSNSAENLADFPVLLRLTGTDIDFDQIQPNGADIRFVDSDGAELDYEIETWDDGAETATVWVRVAQLDAGSTTDFIHIYYDNPNAGDNQNAAGVWDSDYAAVYHLNEAVTDEATSGIHNDSAGSNDGAQDGNSPGAAVIGDGQDFDGVDDKITLGGSGLIGTSNAATFSGWIKHNSLTNTVERYGDLDNNFVIRHDGANSVGQLHFYVRLGGTLQHIRVNGALADDTWYHVAGTWDGTDQRLYLDGAEIGSQTVSGTLDQPLKGQLSATSETLNGSMDEARFSTVARSADWIEASYLSQNGSFAFTDFGQQETGTTDAAAPVVTITRDDSNPTNATSLAFSVDFSEAVSNVDATDFALNLTGTASGDATVTVDDAGDADDATYTVTVTNVAGTGTLGLVLNPSPGVDQLWLSVDGDTPSGTGIEGQDSLTDGTVLFYADSDLTLEPGTTGGLAHLAFNLDDFTTSGDATLDGVHYVSQAVTVGSGAGSFDLLPGDVVFAAGGDETWNNSDLSTTDTKRQDLILFRPDTVGDYSAGTFSILLENAIAKGIHALTLIESDTLVGDEVIGAGNFLVAHTGGGDIDDIFLVNVSSTGVGATSATKELLIEGDDLNFGGDQVTSLDVLEQDTTIGGITLSRGNLLLSLNKAHTVADNSLGVTEHDVFALNVTETTKNAGDGIANATAALVFQGADAGFDSKEEEITALSLNTSPGPTVSITRDDANPSIAASVTFSVDFSEDVSNVDASDFDAALTGTATANATVTVGNAGDADDSTYAVTVSGIDGEGTVGLDFDLVSLDIVATAGGKGVVTTPSTDDVYTVDRDGPVVTSVVLADSALTVGETTTVTISFSEAVTGFDNTDITLANGSLTPISSSDGGITWTGTFTPTDDIEDTTNVISVGTSLTDLAGNAPLAGGSSGNYTIDTREPVASITRNDANPTNAGSVTFSVDFSEAVSNVNADDFDVALAGTATGNAAVTVGNAGDADDSTYTVTVTGVGGDGTVGLDIDAGNVDIIDAAGNAMNNSPLTE